MEPDYHDVLANYAKAFSYGMYGLFNSKAELVHHKKSDWLLMRNVLSHDEFTQKGLCSELMYTAFDFLKHRPDHLVIRASGEDDAFFKGEDNTHSFLLISELPIIRPDDCVFRDVDSAQEITSRDPNVMLFDPSFGRYTRFHESGYVVRYLFGETYKFPPLKSNIVQNNCSVPLCVTSDGNSLVSMGPKKKFKSNLAIIITRPNISEYEIMDLRDEELDRRFETDEHTMSFIHRLRELRVKTTQIKPQIDKLEQY